jgi:hypothetical protein
MHDEDGVWWDKDGVPDDQWDAIYEAERRVDEREKDE